MYKIYPTLLDGYQDYLECEERWNQYFAEKEESPTLPEYEELQKKALIDRINRVPFQSEAADKGTAFNEVVDCMIAMRKSDRMDISCSQDGKFFNAVYNGNTFSYPIGICRDFAGGYKGAISQLKAEAEISTRYGNVLLYGYIDELMPDKVCDIKTTSHYKAFKFRNHNQHLVYPYCLLEMGNDIHTFEYNVTDFKAIYDEIYVFDEELHTPLLKNRLESFISFLEANRNLITDRKIFGYE